MPDKPNFKKLMKMLQHPRDWRVREKAVNSLGELHTPEAMQVLLSALYDESPHVVQAASRALRNFGSEAVPGLLEVVFSPEEIAARPHVVHALREIGDRIVVPDLIRLLNHEEIRMQYAALLALEEMPGEGALPQLLVLLETDDEDFKQRVLQTLGALGSPKAIPAIEPLLRSDDKVTRRYAAIALGKTEHDTALEILIETSQDENENVRHSAAEGLRYQKNQRSFERLVELLEDEHNLTRGMAVRSLAKVNGIRAMPYVLKMRQDPDKKVRGSASGALSSLNSLDVVPILLQQYRNSANLGGGQGLYSFASNYWKFDQRREDAVRDALSALTSDDQNLRIAAVWLLYVFNCELWQQLLDWERSGKKRKDFDTPNLHQEVLEALVSLIDDDNPDIRLSIMESLLRTGDKQAIEGLLRCLEDDDSLIVWKATEALGNIGDESAVPNLLVLLESTDATVRNRTMSALMRIGGEGVFEGLVKMLEHPDSWTRNSAAFELGNLGDQRATPILLERLRQESDLELLEWIVIGLGRLKDQRATLALTEILNDTSQGRKLRSSAVSALQNIRDRAALPALYEAVNNAPEWQICKGAVEAIAVIDTPRQQADRLFELLEHENDTVRTTASEKLGYLGAGTTDLDLRDYIVSNLINRLQDTGFGYHAAPRVAHMAAKSLYYVGTTEAIEALKTWELKQENSQEDNP